MVDANENTRPALPHELHVVAELRIPGPAPLPVRFFLVSMPVSAASPRVIETTCEVLSETTRAA